MAIAIYVPGPSGNFKGFGGFGDWLFGLKILKELKESLRKLGYDKPFYLVTSESGKDKILQLGGDKEFGVEIKSTEEFSSLNIAGDLDYFIEGPVFDPNIHQQITIPDYIPIFLLSEYSLPKGANSAKERLSKSMHIKLNVMQSGFCVANGSNPQLEQGILFSKELIQVAENKRNNCFTFRERYWTELQSFSKKILPKQSIESYHKNTELYFEYSHDKKGSSTIFHRNHCERFLQIHQLFSEASAKNQDIISVGENTEAKRKALTSLLPTLKDSGYSKVIYIDLESGTEEILLNEQQSSEKVYRFYHAKQLTHREMIALQALSEDLVGATGDQSFGEALSCEKLVVYECLVHKKTLANNFLKTFYALDSDSDYKASQLAYLLMEGKIHPETGNAVQRNQLKDLLKDPEVIRQYHAICQKIHKKYDLAESIVRAIAPAVNSSPHHLDLDRHLWKCIYDCDINAFKDVIENTTIDFLASKQQGTSLLTYICTKRKFDFIETILSLQITKGEDSSDLVTSISRLINFPATRHGEHKVRSQGARDRRALTGEAGNASRRQVIVGATARSPEWASAWRTQDESGPNISHVMRTNFGDTMAEFFREHSDSLDRSDYNKLPILVNSLFIQTCCNSYENILSMYQPTEKSNKRLKRNAQKKFLSDIWHTINYHEYETSKDVLILALLLVRNSIRSESYIYHGSKLLVHIEKKLVRLGVKPQDKKLNMINYEALKNHTEKFLVFLENKIYQQDFYKFANSSLDLNCVKEKTPTTRHGEHKVRSQGARDRRALTGEAGNASRRQVIVGATARSPEWASAWRTQDESGPNISHVMQTNFGDTMAEIFREHSDSLVEFKR